MFLANTITIDLQTWVPLLGLLSSAIGAIVSAALYAFNTEAAIKNLLQEIKRLRGDTRNAIVHMEGLTRDMQYYLHEATKDNSNIKTYYIREHQSGHTGANFLKDE